MNSQPSPKDPWTRLIAGARREPDQRDENAPYGFATRVAALAELAPRKTGSLFERFALRAVGVAALLALGSAAYTLTQAPKPAQTSEQQTELASEDALSELVDA